MRLYTFGNFMLSPIQQSIQAAHVVAELFIEYNWGNVADSILHTWAVEYKTIICLNAGNNAGLHSAYSNIAELGVTLSLPYAKFHEDEQSLGGIMTCCGIIVPAKIYVYAAELRNAKDSYSSHLTAQERELAVLLNQYPLAR